MVTSVVFWTAIQWGVFVQDIMNAWCSGEEVYELIHTELFIYIKRGLTGSYLNTFMK